MKSLGLPYSIKNNSGGSHSSNNGPNLFHDHHEPALRPPTHHTAPNSYNTAAQEPPRSPAASSLAGRAKEFFAVRRPAPRVASSNSLHSAYSTHSARARAAARSTDHLPVQNPDPPPPVPDLHPYAAMVASPVPVVSSHDAEDEKECPVCLEPLSFSFRLPGEKPHIVPDCGHALHEVRIALFFRLTSLLISSYTSLGLLYRCVWPTAHAK